MKRSEPPHRAERAGGDPDPTAYVDAQREYASVGHDGKRAGLYARRFGSRPGAHDGLYWPAAPGQPRSPLGVLIAKASQEGYRLKEGEGPSPLHGYYFRIVEAQGKSAKGGAAEYVVASDMSRALVAWPVHYGATGIMTISSARTVSVTRRTWAGHGGRGRAPDAIRPRPHLAERSARAGAKRGRPPLERRPARRRIA
jgi:hypothetical protein